MGPIKKSMTLVEYSKKYAPGKSLPSRTHVKGSSIMAKAVAINTWLISRVLNVRI
jgi:hypothetical protein